MPKEKRNGRKLFQMWFDLEGYSDVSIKGNDLFCTVCERIINSYDKTKVTSHLKSHASSRAEDFVFFYELIDAFFASNIPLNKLENSKFRTFLEKYMDRKIPHESRVRLRCVDRDYNNVMTSIREGIVDNFVYFIIDEAIDACGRSVANFLIGLLSAVDVERSFSLHKLILSDKLHYRKLRQTHGKMF